MNKDIKNKSSLYGISRLEKNFPNYDKIMKLHKKAIDNDEDTYIDPAIGLIVFTALFHLKKGNCCGSGCRHCPYLDSSM